MNALQFRKAVLDVTLKGIDQGPDSWVTFNDSLHTRITEAGYVPDIVVLGDDELSILECSLKENYVLITTDRVICISSEVYEEMYIRDMEKFLNDYEAANYTKVDGKYPKTNKVAIQKIDGSVFMFVIDSHHPAFFSKVLIYNIFSYKKKGRWYLNPSEKKW